MIDHTGRHSGSKWVWLSHVFSEKTPAYGGGPGLEVLIEKSLSRGDSCNKASLTLSNHLGSHVDAPLHFIPEGRSVSEFEPAEWFFTQPVLVDLPILEPSLITVTKIAESIPQGKTNPDLLLIRTGFSIYRGQERYWKSGPGFSPDLNHFLKELFPDLRAVGVDCISLSSLLWRDEGRQAHKEFLGSGMLIFEDLALGNIEEGWTPNLVVAMPLRYLNADGAPCTITTRVSPSSHTSSC